MRGLLLIAGIVCLLVAPAAPAQLPLPPPPGQEPPPEPEPPPPPVITPDPPGTAYTNLGGDRARTFSTGDASLTPPFGVLWTATLGSAIEQVLIADGRVFVDRHSPRRAGGPAVVEALDARNGTTLWSVPVTGRGDGDAYASIAYGEGRIFVHDSDNLLTALDAATGAQVWQVEALSVLSAGGPMVAGGLVIIQGGATIAAYAVADGSKRWQSELQDDAEGGEAAVVGDRVYAHSGCLVHALDRRDGRSLWRHDEGCKGSGYGGGTVTVWRDRVFPRGWGDIGPRRAADGRAADGPVARLVVGDVGLAPPVKDADLDAFDLSTGARLWDVPPAGGRLGLPGHVLSSREAGNALVVRDARSGAERWAARLLPVPVPPDAEYAGFQDPVGGEGIVVVPADHRLIALAPAARVSPEPLTLDLVGRPDRLYGREAFVRGRTGTVLGARRTRLEVAEHPFRRGFRTVAEAATAENGSFRHGLRLTRNARLRVVADDGRVTPARSVYVYPRLRTRFRQRNGRVIGALYVGAPRDVRLSGRRVGLYLGRRGARSIRLLDAARVRRTRGATFVFAPISRREARGALLYTCLRGAHRLGLGRADVLSRRCGRRVIRF